MIIVNKKTGKEIPVTQEGWKVIVDRGWSGLYKKVGDARVDIEVKKKPGFIPEEISKTKKS